MSLNKDASGRRFVQVEVEVPGTPEQVWEAIATGPGISSWFVPTEVEERVGGTATSNFGPGMESISTVTEWDPPRRFAADSPDLGPGAPTVASEWIVEARSGGTCVVRVVHSLFASSDEWDDQLESWESGWPGFFRLLRLYLTHFPGRHGTLLPVMGVSSEPEERAWEALTGALGLTGAAVGERRSAPAGPPRLAGTVEEDDRTDKQFLLLLDEPAPGFAHLFALPMGGQVYLSLRFYLFGKEAAAVRAREEPLWQAWIEEHFPPPAGGAAAAPESRTEEAS